MNFKDLGSLLNAMKQCKACSFANPHIAPLVPREKDVPVQIMFIGENPSWAGDQGEPFAPGTISGKALKEHYLDPLGRTRQQVWITDFIKCRYPAKTKWAGYPLDIYRAKGKYESIVREVACKCATIWLAEEIKLSQPRIIVTLSDTQVYRRFRIAFDLDVPTRFRDSVGIAHDIAVQGFKTILFPMIHPDVSRPVHPPNGDDRKMNVREKWAPLHQNKHIPNLIRLLET